MYKASFLFGFMLLLGVASPQDDDGDGPYEFSFAIDGEQHRYESRDVNGVIQGEFGFITGDGVYHVTVYATDEHGTYKVLSSKNIKISGPLEEEGVPRGKIPQQYSGRLSKTATVSSGTTARLPATTPPPLPAGPRRPLAKLPQVPPSLPPPSTPVIGTIRPVARLPPAPPLSSVPAAPTRPIPKRPPPPPPIASVPISSVEISFPQPQPSSTTSKSVYDFTTASTIRPGCSGCGIVTKPPQGPLPFQNPAFQQDSRKDAGKALSLPQPNEPVSGGISITTPSPFVPVSVPVPRLPAPKVRKPAPQFPTVVNGKLVQPPPVPEDGKREPYSPLPVASKPSAPVDNNALLPLPVPIAAKPALTLPTLVEGRSGLPPSSTAIVDGTPSTKPSEATASRLTPLPSVAIDRKPVSPHPVAGVDSGPTAGIPEPENNKLLPSAPNSIVTRPIALPPVSINNNLTPTSPSPTTDKLAPSAFEDIKATPRLPAPVAIKPVPLPSVSIYSNSISTLPTLATDKAVSVPSTYVESKVPVDLPSQVTSKPRPLPFAPTDGRATSSLFTTGKPAALPSTLAEDRKPTRLPVPTAGKPTQPPFVRASDRPISLTTAPAALTDNGQAIIPVQVIGEPVPSPYANFESTAGKAVLPASTPTQRKPITSHVEQVSNKPRVRPFTPAYNKPIPTAASGAATKTELPPSVVANNEQAVRHSARVTVKPVPPTYAPFEPTAGNAILPSSAPVHNKPKTSSAEPALSRPRVLPFVPADSRSVSTVAAGAAAVSTLPPYILTDNEQALNLPAQIVSKPVPQPYTPSEPSTDEAILPSSALIHSNPVTSFAEPAASKPRVLPFAPADSRSTSAIAAEATAKSALPSYGLTDNEQAVNKPATPTYEPSEPSPGNEILPPASIHSKPPESIANPAEPVSSKPRLLPFTLAQRKPISPPTETAAVTSALPSSVVIDTEQTASFPPQVATKAILSPFSTPETAAGSTILPPSTSIHGKPVAGSVLSELGRPRALPFAPAGREPVSRPSTRVTEASVPTLPALPGGKLARPAPAYSKPAQTASKLEQPVPALTYGKPIPRVLVPEDNQLFPSPSTPVEITSAEPPPALLTDKTLLTPFIPEGRKPVLPSLVRPSAQEHNIPSQRPSTYADNKAVFPHPPPRAGKPTLPRPPSVGGEPQLPAFVDNKPIPPPSAPVAVAPPPVLVGNTRLSLASTPTAGKAVTPPAFTYNKPVLAASEVADGKLTSRPSATLTGKAVPFPPTLEIAKPELRLSTTAFGKAVAPSAPIYSIPSGLVSKQFLPSGQSSSYTSPPSVTPPAVRFSGSSIAQRTGKSQVTDIKSVSGLNVVPTNLPASAQSRSRIPVSTPSAISRAKVSDGMIIIPGNEPIPIRDKYPNMVDGLPDGITEKDITNLLYKFNYTLGFHGHYEKGLKNGAKIGGYFVNGRDGISRVVTYIADENGYRPKVKLINLGLASADTPKPDTEKKFGLKSFEFVWYPVN